jgi:hypothetical protein
LLATVNANVEFARDIQTGFLNRLALTPVRGIVLLLGQLGGLLTIALVQAVFYLVVGVAFGVRLETGVAGALLLLVLEAVIALAFASFGSWAALRTGSTRGGAGALPGLLRVSLPVVDEHPAQSDRDGLVPLGRDHQPRSRISVEACVRSSLYDWHWEADPARLRRRDRHVHRRFHAGGQRTEPADGANMRDTLNVARGVAWRQVHTFFTIRRSSSRRCCSPLFFFAAFVGGLSRITDVPGFDFPLGYTAFQFVFVLLQSAAFSGVFTGFGIARDWETGFMRRLMLAAPNRIGIVIGT